MLRHRIWIAALLVTGWLSAVANAQPPSRGNALLDAYFRDQTDELRTRCLGEVESIADWNTHKDEYRRQLFEMLGLDPLPERTDLKPTITGKLDHAEFTVENLHFQSRPGLYVTGNLYVPKGLTGPVPAILYVCGHGRVAKDGVSFGNKTHYQHHGAWFARNGYVCLVIDTLQLGEIEGIHHGTHRYNRWWWLSRGYTPAGVEAWNCIRALDYLQSRPEVDGAKLGVTGRSGGGAYSWWIAGLDDRIQVAVPVAGITDLQNHVVDGAVEGHCDCMFMVNTYRWDYPQVAALLYPRPLVISNTDRDRIFPLDGVYRTYSEVRRLYELGKAGEKVALNITAGPHADTQELQMHAFRWFDQHLKKEPRIIDKAAIKYFEPAQLKVFDKLPEDEINTKIDETFVPTAAAPSVPPSTAQWTAQRDGWLQALREKSFRAWPEGSLPLDLKPAFALERDGLALKAWDFTSQPNVPLRLLVVQRAGLTQPEQVVLNAFGDSDWTDLQRTLKASLGDELPADPVTTADGFEKWNAALKKMLTSFPYAMAYVAPRGHGLTHWTADEKKQIQIRRRFYLLGQTLEGMQAWDIRRAMQAVRSVDGMQSVPLWLQAKGDFAALAVYASLFEPPVKRLDLYDLPQSHRDGPPLLNVLRFLDLPQAIAMAAERSQVVIYRDDDRGLEYPLATAKALDWPAKQIEVRKLPGER
jgi:dienelactone hydrolase